MKCNFGILHVPKSRSTPQNHHKKQQGKQTNTNTKLQKVNNIQWDMANTTTNKRRKQRTENEKQTRGNRGGESVNSSGMQPVLASLLLQHSLPHLVQHPEVSADKMLKMYLPQKRRDATLQAAGNRQQAASGNCNVDVASRRVATAALCSLLVPLMDLQHFEWFISHVDEMDSNGPHFDVYCSSGKGSGSSNSNRNNNSNNNCPRHVLCACAALQLCRDDDDRAQKDAAFI